MRELFDDITRKIEGHHTTAYFVNGAPGIGKSYLLDELAQHLPDAIPGCVVLPRYEVTSVEALCSWLVRQCYDKFWLDDRPQHDHLLTDLDALWAWLSRNLQLTTNRLVVLLDVSYLHYQPDDSISALFGAVRALENYSDSRAFKLHHVVAGFWNHEALRQHFNRVNTSFPYTIGNNYRVFEGAAEDTIAHLLPADDTYRALHGKLLYELTGGHLGAAAAIADTLTESSLKSMLVAVHQIARQSEVTDRLLSVWRQLTDSACDLLEGLLTHRHLRMPPGSQADEHLLSAGIAQRTLVDETVYLRFRSWYVELALRYHIDQLPIRDKRLARVDVANLAPVLTSLNDEAYRLIRDIEISARNFVSIRLSLNVGVGDSILKGVNRRYDYEVENTTDADERTRAERSRIESYGLSVDLNPQIAYLTTGDLAGILQEIGRKDGDEAWLNIGENVQQMASIRNVVMHNQLVDEAALRTLYDLRAAIYAALNR